MPSKSIALVTGGFDPIHSGHITLFIEAAKLGELYVGVNSDQWLKNKKGYCFMPLEERMEIISNLQMIEHRFISPVFKFNDEDGSAIDAIEQIKLLYPNRKIFFCNGGDRTKENILEKDIKDVELVFGIGGTEKINSSSTIGRVKRSWGWYKVLYNAMTTKVKELQIEAGQSMSIQRHFKRNEFWFVSEGECTAIFHRDTHHPWPEPIRETHSIILTPHEHYTVSINTWHNLYNHTDKPCRMIEIQYGEECEELDIERAN